MTDRTRAEEERLVDVLRPHQLAKLERDRDKGHWGADDPRYLVQRAKDEFEELLWDMDASGWERGVAGAVESIAREAADVANFLGMLVDVLQRRETQS